MLIKQFERLKPEFQPLVFLVEWGKVGAYDSDSDNFCMIIRMKTQRSGEEVVNILNFPV
ncbi:MAG: hypothetical protein J1F43_05790 [Muribaculaceae bacterium]|nr:hypothetical protein [Muribaculaceae bacterium]